MLTDVKKFQKTHSVNSILNLIISISIVVLVFISIVINILAAPTEIVEEVGTKTFRMFTVLSNMLMAVSAAMTIPFAVDGIRQRNYHLPRWIVNLSFMGVNCVSLTFLVALGILSPRAGFSYIMIEGSNLFLHTLVPIMAIVSFLFVNAYHTVKFKATFLATAPVFVYAMVYLVSAIFIGEENGGWRDHYRFEDLMPWYYILVIMLLFSFGIASLLRFIHNRVHRNDKLATVKYYQEAEEYDLPTIEDAIRKIAADNKKLDRGGEVTVPRRIILILENKYKSEKSLSYLCSIYTEEYLK
jgi:hypothetical protein